MADSMITLPIYRCPACGAIWSEGDGSWLFYEGGIFHLCGGQWRQAEIIRPGCETCAKEWP